MTKLELVKELAATLNMTQALAREMVETSITLIVKAIKQEGVLELGGLGSFRKIKRQARRITAFGKPKTVPAHNIVKFSPAKTFKDAIK
jgi:nucleoid DNA-binding protein